MSWKLDETVQTSAGTVAAGRLGSGPALVLAHGWPWSSFSWHRIIPDLARRYRVHWYDMPGYGQSHKGAEYRTSLDVQGKVFAEMLAYWDLKKPMIVAHDFGGATTLRAHLLHGCDFKRYVLMNVVAMRPWGSEFFDHVGRNVDAFLGLPPHIHRAIVEAYIKGAIVNDVDPGDLEKLVLPWLSEEGRGSFYRQFAQADERYTAEVEPMYGDIRCPVKILWGEDDPWIPLERGKALHALIPQASFETLPRTGHLPQLEVPNLVQERLNAFLSRAGEDR
ncbi:pimeloyl-ACP methyl ester carboxylesterase [Sinorhizobium kostiense]|uniref:Pimeloyl-ACP methyl ester carboxylesterase n=1 Tax=Sinorhizobium kostiense TaxID=76747 RepID=A0ABS4R5T1_9HYPH|nr:alpha/beta hydrolase [Sinorhizobium kostiense]MBP2238251.1 pimeloyl-ACP methyl ester carboxylesterase [Sinorhizobium kostiense]